MQQRELGHALLDGLDDAVLLHGQRVGQARLHKGLVQRENGREQRRLLGDACGDEHLDVPRLGEVLAVHGPYVLVARHGVHAQRHQIQVPQRAQSLHLLLPALDQVRQLVQFFFQLLDLGALGAQCRLCGCRRAVQFFVEVQQVGARRPTGGTSTSNVRCTGGEQLQQLLTRLRQQRHVALGPSYYGCRCGSGRRGGGFHVLLDLRIALLGVAVGVSHPGVISAHIGAQRVRGRAGPLWVQCAKGLVGALLLVQRLVDVSHGGQCAARSGLEVLEHGQQAVHSSHSLHALHLAPQTGRQRVFRARGLETARQTFLAESATGGVGGGLRGSAHCQHQRANFLAIPLVGGADVLREYVPKQRHCPCSTTSSSSSCRFGQRGGANHGHHAHFGQIVVGRHRLQIHRLQVLLGRAAVLLDGLLQARGPEGDCFCDGELGRLRQRQLDLRLCAIEASHLFAVASARCQGGFFGGMGLPVLGSAREALVLEVCHCEPGDVQHGAEVAHPAGHRGGAVEDGGLLGQLRHDGGLQRARLLVLHGLFIEAQLRLG
mmetsp:Transcript_70705/g.147245  ORF Transcript_70705/g.147245 Transcript_70705/m.147245 type:complete len:546 (+) Transcript_70705:254-1891(+)